MQVAIDEKSLEYVTDEIHGQEKWYFHPSDKSYVRLCKAAKKMSAHIYGRFLPDNPSEMKSNASKKLIAHWRKHGGINNNI